VIILYGKSWVAILYAVAIALQAALSDRTVTLVEAVQIGIALVTAAGVYMVPLTSNYKWVKTGLAVVLAMLQALATLLLGPHSGDVWTLVITAVGAGLVLLAPATTVNPSGTGDVSVPLGLDV
jgi:hypothetical protein